MASVLSLVLIVTLSILITRFATIALVHTGLSKRVARFQARSAFTGVGYATRESERVVGHPVRRSIIMILMLLGNVGIISVLASLVLTFVDNEAGTSEWLKKTGTLAGSIVILWLLSRSKWIDKALSRWINHLLHKYTDIQVRDYAGILHLSGEYEITEMLVEKNHWMASQNLSVLNLRQEGLNLIGVEREDGYYVGMPSGETRIMEGDTLIMYGKESALKRLNDRKKNPEGDLNRREAVRDYRETRHEEDTSEQPLK